MLLGLLGGGGSIMAVPVLVYALGLDLEQAILISLIVIAVASAFGALPKVRAGQVQWRLAGVFAAVGIPATFVGAAIGDHLSQAVIMVGLRSGHGRCRDPHAARHRRHRHRMRDRRWRDQLAPLRPRSIPAGFVVGLLTGLFGVGGGFLIIPALVVVLGVEMPIAVGTSLLIIAANSAAGVLSHLHDATINWALTAAFVGTAIVGSLVAGQLGTNLDNTRLQRWFAYLVFVVAAYVLVDNLLLR